MAILEIKKYPDPILRKKAEEVKEITPEIKKLIEDMKETLKENRGLGLAAPQVGVLKRVIAVETPGGIEGFSNPQILKAGKETEILEEGCLSFPALFLKIKRAKEVEVKALGINGHEVKIEAKGLMACLFQHEIDHLNGILFIDHINFWQRFKSKFF